MTKALLSLGSNMGERLEYLRSAVAELGKSVVAASKVYETPPWPSGEIAPLYLNAAVLVSDAHIDAHGWLAKALELEQKAGRIRDPMQQFAPRTLDVDVIMVWDETGRPVISNDPDLTLPHPRAHLRAFVLKPWHDIDASGQLPGHEPIKDLLHTETIAQDLNKMQTITALL